LYFGHFGIEISSSEKDYAAEIDVYYFFSDEEVISSSSISEAFEDKAPSETASIMLFVVASISALLAFPAIFEISSLLMSRSPLPLN
jgi:hypothetical protein